MIYHVITQHDWEKAQHQGYHEPASLELEGFIHASGEHQVAGVISRYYKDVQHLLLLHINEEKLTAELKFELAPSVNEVFPHIFGRLNLDAIEKVSDV
ncbi:MAG: DUF952 domain-containing protein [Bacteroidota bacterium]|nr:DUF952 domain-containing protein [Ferruginibacter sp.]